MECSKIFIILNFIIIACVQCMPVSEKNTDTYPTQDILEALKRLEKESPEDLEAMLLKEVPTDFNVTESHRQKREAKDDTMELCKSFRKYTPDPMAQRVIDGKKYHIVNIEGTKYTQRIETVYCQEEDKEPAMKDELCLPVGYKAKCKTQNIQKRVLAFDDDKKEFIYDSFYFHAACVCVFEKPAFDT